MWKTENENGWGKKRLKLKSKNSKLLFSTVACTESARTAVVPQRLCSLIKFWNIISHSVVLDFDVCLYYDCVQLWHKVAIDHFW